MVMFGVEAENKDKALTENIPHACM
jgi:hypothetical protein